MLARLGGDEFAVLLSGCEMDEAARVAVDLAALVGAQRFVFDGVERGVTASDRARARAARSSRPAAMLAAADRAMYAAKAVGGGRVRGHKRVVGLLHGPAARRAGGDGAADPAGSSPSACARCRAGTCARSRCGGTSGR